MVVLSPSGLKESAGLNGNKKNCVNIATFDRDCKLARAAHANSETLTFNYSIKEQKELKLEDLFTPNSDYLNLLSQLSRTHLKEQLDERYFEMIDEGTPPKEVVFSSFLVEKTGLSITFNQYQVASYAEGIQEILIPSIELKPDYLF